MGRLTPRGLVLILVAGLILAIGAAGAARRDEPSKQVGTTVPPAVAADPGGLEANVVRASLPPERTVRAELGETVELTVSSEMPDYVRIVELGVRAPVGPGLDGKVRFDALRAGTFDIRLEIAGTSAGKLVVDAAPGADAALGDG